LGSSELRLISADDASPRRFADDLAVPMVALSTPGRAPSGATAAAWSLASAAALVEMGARARSNRQGRRAVAISDRAATLRSEALRLGDLDLTTAQALIHPGSASATPRELEARLARATIVPKAIVVHSIEVIGLATEVQRSVGPLLDADMKAAASLASGACSAATAIVTANLSEIDEATCEAARRLADYARSECTRLS